MDKMQAAWAGMLLAAAVLTNSTAAIAQEAAVATFEEKADVVKGNSEFAVALYAKLQVQQGNLFFSPYSISTALAMTYAGARGETSRQMAEALRFAPEQGRLHATFAAIAADVAQAGKAKGVVLHIANALWEERGHGILDEFRRIVKTAYGGRVEEVSFTDDAEGVRRTINEWVAEQTQGKIRDLIGPGVLSSLTRLVLTNAIYFKGAWLSAFEQKATRDEPFWTSATDSIPVPMMNQTGRFRYAESDQVQVLELPYAGREISMTVLLPKKKDGLAELERGLTLDQLSGRLSGLREQKVLVQLPKFKVTSQFELRRALGALGMTDAFCDRADFSGIDGKKDLFISAVIHKAFVDVSEEGTEAAAATAVAIGVTSIARPAPVPEFRADHPFMFLIRHVPSGTILFLGRVANPKE
jgi:serpin B